MDKKFSNSSHFTFSICRSESYLVLSDVQIKKIIWIRKVLISFSNQNVNSTIVCQHHLFNSVSSRWAETITNYLPLAVDYCTTSDRRPRWTRHSQLINVCRQRMISSSSE